MSDALLFGGPHLWDRVLARGEVGGPIVRAAGAGRCKACEAFLIQGLDGDQCALDARADADPVSALGEAHARILGLRTYELWRTKGAWNLELRDMGAIRRRPAGSGVVDVLAEHLCGLILDHAELRNPPRQITTDTEPPF